MNLFMGGNLGEMDCGRLILEKLPRNSFSGRFFSADKSLLYVWDVFVFYLFRYVEFLLVMYARRGYKRSFRYCCLTVIDMD